jgi:hypothetical protein
MRFIGSAFLGIVALALLIGWAGSSDTAEAARITLRGVATGSEEIPPVVAGGSVQVTFVFDDVTNDISYAATISGLSADLVTAAHFHRAPRGTNGPIIYTLSDKGFTQISGVQRLTAADVADLRAGNLYFNAHSKENPGGFARFQLVLPAGATPAAPIAAPAPATTITPPSTGDAGLAATSNFLPLFAIAAFCLAGFSVFALARKRT